MDNLDLLSDDELRIRLLQYGFANLPITQTTRKTLIKKLRNHLNNTSSSLRKNASLATRYSSGEESDNIDSKSSRARKTRLTVSGSPVGRTQTMPPPMFGSGSQPIMTPSKSSSPAMPTATYSRGGINTSGSKKSSVYVSPVIINDSDDDIDWNTKKNRAPSNLKNSSRNRSANFNSTLDSSQRNSNDSNGNDQEDADDANTTSDYTRRLLQLREGNIQNNYFRKRPTFSNSQRLSDYQPLSENDIVYHAEPSSSLETAHIPLNIAIKNFVNRLDAAYGFKQTFVPMVLVTFLIIFFLLIIFAYVTISPNIENILDSKTTAYVPCSYQMENDASYSCIDEQRLDSSLSLLKVLASELQARVVAQRCTRDGKNSVSNVICVKDFWQYLNEHQLQHSQGLDLIKDMHNIEYLVDHNKQWGISNVNFQGEPISMNDVFNLRAHQAECFAILKPKLPISCTIYNKIQTFFVIIGTLSIISAMIFFVRKFYQFVLQVRERRRQQVDQIIREICTTLMEKAMQDKENSAIVLNHLREKIIEPSKRSELAWAWQEAIGYLEQNDSRIHFGVDIINGEDTKVIRWVDEVKKVPAFAQPQQQQRSPSRYTQPTTDGRHQYATLKKWMGSAFDKSNKIKDPPTNCLKIRQMFDKHEATNPNLQTIIQDTILYKLREKNCKVYDIQLDLKTCCVYVKTASCADAGIVHEEINGWWLDAGLVVVKFLKQDKYHQRFPNAINSTTSMQPSSNLFITQNESSSNGHEDYFDDEIDDDFE